ncbi:MAG: hypothetical protein J6X49_02390 [Victivallales bacterium]|nr:hypothetical protein [Victivallales bacterium]
MTEERVFQCTGCEAQCDVCVRLQDGKIIAVEGNDCPTGASYATSQCKHQLQQKSNILKNK